MRVVAESVRPEFKITVFSWNQKYLIKLEQAGLEQTYKLSETEVDDEKSLQRMLSNEVFLKEAAGCFETMRASWQKAIESL